GQRGEFLPRQVMQEEDGDRRVETSLDCASLLEASVSDAELRRIGASLPNSRRGEVDARHLGDMRRKQQFGVADAASEAQYSRGSPGAGHFRDPMPHVPAQRPHGGPREGGRREAGVDFLVVFELAFEDAHRARSGGSMKATGGTKSAPASIDPSRN